MKKIAPSELIINDDGSIFHLHLRPEDIADTVILVGDPGRVELVASYFDNIELRKGNREFVTVTGIYKKERVSVLSTGIGTDNIDIVVNELDALVNIDFKTRTVKENKTRLTLLRLGTCGAIQDDIKIGDFILSRTSAGFDGLLSFYEGRDDVCDMPIEKAFTGYVGWGEKLSAPYFVNCSEKLAALFAGETIEGITVSAPGFYGPQGRALRINPTDPKLNEKIASFRWQGRRITNIEMESSALAGLAALLGHDAATICTVIAQRAVQDMDTDYRSFVERMIVMSLDKLASI